MTSIRVVVCALALLLALTPVASAQSVTGQISGVVTDPTGAVVAGATVQLTHELSKHTREFTTESAGSFIFTGLVPGSYSIRVAQRGFNTQEQKGITVAAQERVDLHDVRLEVGDVTTSV